MPKLLPILWLYEIHNSQIQTVMKHKLTILFLLCCTAFSLHAQPTDNPYRSRYWSEMPAAPFHWTDSLRWNNVVNISNYSNLVRKVRDFSSNFEEDSLNDWLLAFQAAQTQVLSTGGGVIYFPKLPQKVYLTPGADSSYYFSDNLLLRSNVILRGPTPTVTDAKSNGFSPDAFLEFPKYVYKGDQGVNTDNNTAFKEITIDPAESGPGQPGFKNIGLVYMDINRGRISAHPTFTSITVGTQTNIGVANQKPRNYLILGIRSNNVAIPDLNIPSAIQASGSQEWHRWPWRFGSNIDIYVAANCIIAGCRLNDYQNNTNANRLIQNDDFAQAGYKPKPASNEPACSPSPEQAKFDYNRHYGIILNRLKKTGYNSTLSFQSNSGPQQEPELFAPGNMVVDNWVYKTSRVAIQATGLGLVIKGNIMKDVLGKESIIDATGQNCLRSDYSGSTPPTFENRGIDFSGWNVRIENNETEVYRIKLLPSNAYSSDGEGWYYQGVGGGTARNIWVSGNTFIGNSAGLCDALSSSNRKGFNGFANTVNLQNIKVINNNFGGIPFRIQTQGTPPANYTIQGLEVSGNTNLHSIEVRADGCGDESKVFNNSKTISPVPSCGIPDLNIDCFTSLNADPSQRNENSNTGFSTYPPNPNGDDRPGCANVCPTQTGCALMSLSITDPTDPGVVYQPNTNVFFNVKYSSPGCQPDSLILYKNQGIVVQKITSANLQQGTDIDQLFVSYSTPPSGLCESLYAVIYKDNFSRQSSIYNVCLVSSEKMLSQSTDVKMYPNPASGTLHFEFEGTDGYSKFLLTDLMGRALMTESLPFGHTTISVSDLALGTYLVRLQIKNQWLTKRLVIE
jgi:hypothetical protein